MRTRATELHSLITEQKFSQAEILQHRQHVYDEVLKQSKYIKDGNFQLLHPDDLRLLFDAYDQAYLHGLCRQALGDIPLQFRISRRMTSAGGKTTATDTRSATGVRRDYEIAVSGTLLFQNFQDGHPIRVTGVDCRDRLEGLQRVMEHEIVHLAEMLIWNGSSCTAQRFRAIANSTFGHTEHGHRLITPRERALRQFGIRAGDRVRFQMEGRDYEGLVNRITKRATVLVEDDSGAPYTDGRRYAKYYVPIGMLKRVG